MDEAAVLAECRSQANIVHIPSLLLRTNDDNNNNNNDYKSNNWPGT